MLRTMHNIEEYLQINNRIYAKIEKFNPGGSSKDRPAYQIIKEAIEKEKIDKELKEKITILNSEINLLEEDTKKLEKEIKQEKEDIIFKFNLDKQDISKELEININIEEKDKIEKELEYSNKKIVEYKLELNGLKYEENEVNDKLEDSISKEEEYENLQEQLDELEEKNKYILATKELLEKAYEKMKKNITPKFTFNLSENIKNIIKN